MYMFKGRKVCKLGVGKLFNLLNIHSCFKQNTGLLCTEGGRYWSQWPRSLRHGSVAARLLGLWVSIPRVAWLFVCCECCVLSGRGLCCLGMKKWNIGGSKVTTENWSTTREFFPSATRSHVAHWVTWDRNQASLVRGQLLTASDTAIWIIKSLQ